MRRALSSFYVLCVAFVLTACGGGGNVASSSGAAALANAACVAAEAASAAGVPGVALAYPPNGSANVSPNIGEVIVSGASTSQSTLAVTTSSGTVIANQTPAAAPSPLPSPLAAPPPGPVSYAFITLPTLALGTTYKVSYSDTISANSSPCTITQAVGSFST